MGSCDVHIRTLRYQMIGEVPVMYTLVRPFAVGRLAYVVGSSIDVMFLHFGSRPTYAVNRFGAQVTRLISAESVGAIELTMDLNAS